jgi:hypothetical protein
MGPFFKFLGSLMLLFHAKSVFLAVNVSLRWLNNVSCLLLSFPLITNGVYTLLLCIDKCGLACYLYCTKSGWRCIGRFPPALG